VSLIRKTGGAVVWSIAGGFANNAVSFIVFAIIAHLVSPRELGVAAFAMVFIELGKIISGVGVPNFLVQRKEWDEAYASMCFWVNLGAAVLLVLLSCLVVAPVIEYSFAEGSAIVLIVLSICYPVDAIRVVHESRLRREFNFKRMAARGSAAAVLSGIIGVSLAFMGYGVWALVVQRVSNSILTTIFTWLAFPWTPRFTWVPSEFRPLIVNGSRLMGAVLLGNFGQRSPDLLLGAFLGPVAVAVYRVGARGYEAILQVIVQPLINAVFSGFARLKDEERLRAGYLRAIKLTALVIFPIILGTAAVAPEFVEVAFGSNWDQSALVLQVLAISMAPAVFGFMIHPLLSALNYTRAIFWINMSSMIGTVAICLALVWYGPVGVAVAIAIKQHLAGVLNVYLMRRVINASKLQSFLAVLPAYVAAGTMLAVLLGLRYFLFGGAAGWQQAVAMVVLGACIYPAVLWVFWRNYWNTAIGDFAQMFPRFEPLLHRIFRYRQVK
jgi:O-antigen/teichoic acid export membrane protein